jgi:hypothetical protein
MRHSTIVTGRKAALMGAGECGPITCVRPPRYDRLIASGSSVVQLPHLARRPADEGYESEFLIGEKGNGVDDLVRQSLNRRARNG